MASVRVEENLRAEPNGVLLGRLLPGTTLTVGEREDEWIRGEVEGWVWMASLRTTDRLGLDLVVTPQEGENLRSEPQGTVLGRLEPGTLLEEVERTTGWIRVRRTGWIWAESVEVDGSGGGEGEDADAGAGLSSGAGTAAAATAAGGREEGGGGLVRVPPGGFPVLGSPDGDTLARAVPGAEVQILAREGGWARVRIDGWSWLPGGSSSEPDASPDSSAELTLVRVRETPGAFRGRVVRWSLQFISLERAERVRTEFFEGEPFLLTRTPGGDGSFVYVAVPPDRLDEVQGLVPLERITVVARIRAGASALTGSPVLDLLELQRQDGR